MKKIALNGWWFASALSENNRVRQYLSGRSRKMTSDSRCRWVERRYPDRDAGAAVGASGFWLASPKSADFCLFEDVITGQELIRAFASHDNLIIVFAHQPGEQEHGHRRSASERCFAVPDHLRKNAPDIGMRGVDNVVIRAQEFSHAQLEFSLIKLGVLEGNREGIQVAVRVVADNRRSSR